ncbi:MAG: hypothetical protein WC277_08550 [Bacilli bacterium]
MDPRTISLQITGAGIAQIFDAAQEAGLTLQDLDEFENMLEHRDTVLPMVDPTAWVNGGSVEIVRARKRVQAVRGILQVLAQESGSA